ncbi:D-alanine--D-alanine ligase family protein [Aurantimicrobium minutum]|uniref:D-alanine--D-alanine ligase family protein n=1 Tax=Aurantimicrobium minutum TaxID=708131 RepID=UPI00247580F7|nr:D-alanine--D-alanine ligase [Aurantimicrobium minutum]MDH6238634.1 D-alanine-D-alanine ligase [Aurantimicrobium minutum]
MSSLTIAVLSGGISHEREVSLRSGRRVADALIARGHKVTIIDPDASLFAMLASLKPDVVWPALHGASGEDGAILDLLRAAGYSYVGPSAQAARLAWSKPVAKTLVSRAGVATAPSLTIAREAFRELGAGSVLELIGSELGKHVVVKPASGGSAQGVSIVTQTEDLPRAMVDAFTYHDVALIEKYISGTEVAVTVTDGPSGPQALPAVEIVPLEGVYSFEARYNAGETTFFVPARLSDQVSAAIASAAVTVHETLGLSQISRIDLIVDDSGVPWFLEANSLPGLTETSSAPLAIEASGVDVGALYEALARAAQN